MNDIGKRIVNPLKNLNVQKITNLRQNLKKSFQTQINQAKGILPWDANSIEIKGARVT